MKKIGTLFVCVLLAACGGSKSGGSNEPAVATEETVPAAETASYEPPPAAETADPAEPAAPPAAEPVPAAPEPPAPTMVVATADLKSVKDDTSMGTITFEKTPEGKITINGNFTGLKKKGMHAFYVHENGDCSAKGKNIGGHLNPTKAKHGPPSSATRHAGDFGNLTADEEGNATFTMETDSVTMEADRPDSILNRAIVIHASKDDKKGKGGAVLACGVITLRE